MRAWVELHFVRGPSSVSRAGGGQFAALLLLASCAFDPRGVSGDGGRPVDDGGRPVDDGGRPVDDGGRPVDDGGRPVDDSGVPVAPDARLVCDLTLDTRCGDDGRTLYHCGVDGAIAVVPCPGLCVALSAPHCSEVVPSNGLAAPWTAGAVALVVPPGERWILESDSGAVSVCNGGALTSIRAAGAGLVSGIYFTDLGAGVGVFAVDSLSVGAGATLRVVGVRGVALLARGDIVIAGALDLSAGSGACSAAAACTGSADRRCSGPGGGAGGSIESAGGGLGGGGHGGSGDWGEDGGGGGAGFAAEGGLGGSGGNAGARGGSYGAVELVPLVGGSGGGGGREGSAAGSGGGGGGALQLTSVRGLIRVGDAMAAAAIHAGGAGGGTGNVDGWSSPNGAGGGGSGGAILLEARALELVAGSVIAANGGGGGASGGTEGESGRAGTSRALGGVGGRHGGDGGAGTNAHGLDGAGDGDGDGTGGGGGAVGRVRLNVFEARLVVAGDVSPAATVGAVLTE